MRHNRPKYCYIYEEHNKTKVIKELRKKQVYLSVSTSKTLESLSTHNYRKHFILSTLTIDCYYPYSPFIIPEGIFANERNIISIVEMLAFKISYLFRLINTFV